MGVLPVGAESYGLDPRVPVVASVGAPRPLHEELGLPVQGGGHRPVECLPQLGLGARDAGGRVYDVAFLVLLRDELPAPVRVPLPGLVQDLLHLRLDGLRGLPGDHPVVDAEGALRGDLVHHGAFPLDLVHAEDGVADVGVVLIDVPLQGDDSPSGPRDGVHAVDPGVAGVGGSAVELYVVPEDPPLGDPDLEVALLPDHDVVGPPDEAPFHLVDEEEGPVGPAPLLVGDQLGPHR